MSINNDFYTAVGFIAGEGSIGFKGTNEIRLDVGQIESTPLLLLVETLGGKVRGPYARSSHGRDNYNRKPIWQWTIRGAKAASVIMTMLPVLKRWHTGKYEQAITALKQWRVTLPPSKSWMYCSRGHRRIPENQTIAADGGKRCKECIRTYSRELWKSKVQAKESVKHE